MNKRIKLLLLILWTILVFVLMVWPMKPGDPDIFSYQDKIAHFLLFGVFSFLVADCFWTFNKLTQKKCFSLLFYSMFFGAISGIAFSLLTEILQYFLPTRTLSIFDLMSGSLGALFFTFIFYVKERRG